MLARFYRWYDRLKNPQRFLMFAGMTFPWIIMIHVESLGLEMRLLCLLVLLSLFFTRVFYIHGKRL